MGFGIKSANGSAYPGNQQKPSPDCAKPGEIPLHRIPAPPIFRPAPVKAKHIPSISRKRLAVSIKEIDKLLRNRLPAEFFADKAISIHSHLLPFFAGDTQIQQ